MNDPDLELKLSQSAFEVGQQIGYERGIKFAYVTVVASLVILLLANRYLKT